MDTQSNKPEIHPDEIPVKGYNETIEITQYPWSQVYNDGNAPEDGADVTGEHEGDISLANLGEKSFSSLTAGTITSKAVELAVSTGDVYFAGKSSGKTYDWANWTVNGGLMLGIDDSDSDKAKFFVGDSGGGYLKFDGDEVLATDISVLTKYTAGENITAGMALCLGRQEEAENDTGGTDAWTEESNPTTNYDGQATIKVGRDASDKKLYSCVQFNISDFPDSVESVKFRFKVTNITDSVKIQIQRITASWSADTLTWNTLPASEGNYGEQTITTIGWKEIDITDLYNLWKEGVYTNYGIKLIYNAVSSLPDICTISSTESAYSSNLFTDGLVDTDKVWKTNGSKPFNTYNFIGFAKDSVSADATVRVIAPYAKVSGMEDEDLANLVPGEKYYLSDTLLGYITKTPPDYAYDVGIALTTTTLFSSVGSKYAHGVESLATTDDGYKIHSVGFRPILVKIDAIGDVNGASYVATSHGSGDAAHENCIYGVTDEATYSRGTNETYIAHLETALVGGDTTGDLTKLGKTTFIIDWTVLEETVYKWEAFG